MFDPIAILHDYRISLRQRFFKNPLALAFYEFVTFGIKQAWACLFGGLMLSLILLTYMFYPADATLTRYDFLTIGAILIQLGMLVFRLETIEEAKIILVFHVVGTLMEIFKTHVGSWVYPEPSLLRIGDVPMFSGFMYACVGSYIARAWRIFDFRFDHFPSIRMQGLLALFIYLNFFSHHFGPDIRLGLFAITVVIYGPTKIWFKSDESHRPMPLLLGLFLVAIFIWMAENIGTYARAWSYPGQELGWHMVSVGKLGSWLLLMIISFVLVAWLHQSKPKASNKT